MWVIYHTARQQIVGVTADVEPDLDKQAALAEVVSGLLSAGALEEYDAIQVVDRAMATRYMAAFPDKLAVASSGGTMRLSIRDVEFCRLHVTTDAPDVHPVDGIAEIAADGKSSALITLQKIDERGKPMRSVADGDRIFLRTDRGVLRDADGKQEISEVLLAQGSAQFRLYSETAKRVATVQIFNRDRKLRDTKVRIEFI